MSDYRSPDTSDWKTPMTGVFVRDKGTGKEKEKKRNSHDRKEGKS